MSINKQIIMKTRPVGMPKLENFEIIENEIPEIRNGEVLIKILWLSLDPYMRGRMSTAKSYAASLHEGDVIVGGAVGRVIKSETKEYKEGDIVEGFTLGWQEYAIATPAIIRKIDPNLAPIQTAVGVLGMPGMTAFFGLLHVGKPIPGDTVVVSAASGAVGQLLGQIAKIAGCYVVGIAGGEEKCNFLVLGYFENGFRHLSNWKKKIAKPEDLLGMSIRTLGSNTHNRTFEILGMHPKSMRLDEAKLAIEKHEVDAQENPFANTMTYGIHRIHKFHTLSNHFYLSRGIYANPQNYNSWPDDIQKAIPDIIKEAVPFQRNLAVEEEKIARQEIEKLGGTVHELTIEDNRAFKRVLAPIYKEVRDRMDESLLKLLD